MKGSSVPNVVVAFWYGDDILWITFYDPGGAVRFVAPPQHRAALGKTSAHHANLLVDDSIVKPDVQLHHLISHIKFDSGRYISIN